MAQRSPLTKVVNCLNCEKPFNKRPRHEGQIHCSLECRKEYTRKHPKPKSKYVRRTPGNRPIVTYVCKGCNREFQDQKRTIPRVYCSRMCAVKHIHAPRQWPMRLCLHCQQPFRPRKKRPLHCCQECREQSPIGQFAKKLEGHYRTDIEAIVEQHLQALNVRYEFEKQFGKYWVDFFLPDYNLAIECDGVYWHNSERDQKRDINLKEKYHIRIQRFTDKQICGNIQDLIIATLTS